MLMEEALRRITNNLPDQDQSKDPEISETSLERPKLVPFQKFSSQSIKVPCALTLKYRQPCTVLHGKEQAVELHNGHAICQKSQKKLRERIRCL